MHSVLIATLGAEPQVITLATELLLAQHEALVAVAVLHTDPERLPDRQALGRLRAHFAGQADWPPLHFCPIPAADVLEPAEFDHFTNTLYTVLKQWVMAQVRVHLLLAGGRKPMALLGMSVAQLLLGPADRIWYLHSDETLRQSGRLLRAAGDHAQLIPIPLPNLAPTPPLFARATQAATPAGARQALDQTQAQRVQHFLRGELTPAERQVALLIAQDVLTVKEIADRLGKSPKTVTNQLNTIYSKLESFFALAPDVGVKREFLRWVVGLDGS